MRLIVILFLYAMLSGTLWAQGIKNVEQVNVVDPSDTINAIVIDKENNKYIGTNGGLFMVPSASNQPELILEGQIHALAWNRSGGGWAAYRKRMITNWEKAQYIELDGENIEIQCLEATPGKLWIGTNNGVYVASIRQNRIIKHYTTDNSILRSNHINAIHQDAFRVLWVGTDKGVIRIEDDNWKLYEKKARVTAITHNDEGVWIASDIEMWWVDEYNRWAPTAVDKGLSSGTVKALAADGRGNLYLVSDILVQFNPYSEEVAVLDPEYDITTTARLSIATDQEDQIWLGSGQKGLFRMDADPEKADQLHAILIAEALPDCHETSGGHIKAIVRGGTPPYQYKWSGLPVSGPEATDLLAGDYTLEVLDARGKKYEAKLTLTDPRPLQIDVQDIQAVSAAGKTDGQAKAVIEGGTPPYAIYWASGELGAQAAQLGPGQQIVKVTDAKGCSGEAIFTIQEPKILPDLSIDRVRVGQTLRIDQLYFEADSATIRPESHEILDEIYAFLETHKEVAIEIGGHTNNIPSHEYCDRLSTSRARSVATYLYQKGIPESRISYKGYGKRNPVASNESPSGRKKNQRVEIKILSLGK